MCLGIPAKITAITDQDKGLALANTGGIEREVNIAMLDLQGKPFNELVGCYVLLHVGFAMTIIDPIEAENALHLLKEIARKEDKWT